MKKLWRKCGTCKICQNHYWLKTDNVLPIHRIKGIICPGSNQAGNDHKYEKGE